MEAAKATEPVEEAERNGYAHFMLKEIFEQPAALQRALDGMAAGAAPLPLGSRDVGRLERIVMVGMGTARHAALVGKWAIQRLAGLPVDVEFASAFRDGDVMLPRQGLIIAVSQSGETADTLAAVREARDHGLPVWAVTNVEGSTLAREADAVMYTSAGPERAVPSTKAYAAQLAVLYALGVALGRARGMLDGDDVARWQRALGALPAVVADVLERQDVVVRAAQRLMDREHAFFIGRGLDVATALEGALKLKEVSYVHAEGYDAGEFRHGSLALVNEGDPVVAVATQPHSSPRMMSNVQDVAGRGAWVWLVTGDGEAGTGRPPWECFPLPPVEPLLAPVVSVVPLQLLAYHTARLRGCPIDSPRNLTKSVTSE